MKVGLKYLRASIVGLVSLIIGLLGVGVWFSMITAIVIENQRSQRISDVHVIVARERIQVGAIGANSRKTVRLPSNSKFGESDIEFRFNNGFTDQEWRGGYIEPGYKIKLIVSDTGIRDENLSIQAFLLGL